MLITNVNTASPHACQNQKSTDETKSNSGINSTPMFVEFLFMIQGF